MYIIVSNLSFLFGFALGIICVGMFDRKIFQNFSKKITGLILVFLLLIISIVYRPFTNLLVVSEDTFSSSASSGSSSSDYTPTILFDTDSSSVETDATLADTNPSKINPLIEAFPLSLLHQVPKSQRKLDPLCQVEKMNLFSYHFNYNYYYNSSTYRTGFVITYSKFFNQDKYVSSQDKYVLSPSEFFNQDEYVSSLSEFFNQDEYVSSPSNNCDKIDFSVQLPMTDRPHVRDKIDFSVQLLMASRQPGQQIFPQVPNWYFHRFGFFPIAHHAYPYLNYVYPYLFNIDRFYLYLYIDFSIETD